MTDHPTVLQTIKARHDDSGKALELMTELIEALAACTVGWGCNEVEVAQLYIDETRKRRAG